MELGKNIFYYRKQKGMSQEQLADAVNVSFQTVSAWKRDAYAPQVDKLVKVAEVLDVSLDDLCSNHPEEPVPWNMRDQMFSVDHMYRFIRTYAQSNGAVNTAAALPYAKKMHAGQYRKGNGKVPYIYHPLVVACHSLALGLNEDELIASCLLHDVCEDCKDEAGNRIKPEDLPVNEVVQETVKLVTKPEEKYPGWESEYYSSISKNRLAVIVKVLDRCNNISMMATGFSKNKMKEYILETEKYVMPLVDILKKQYEDTCYNAAFLIKYQMLSNMENLKRVI